MHRAQTYTRTSALPAPDVVFYDLKLPVSPARNAPAHATSSSLMNILAT